MQQILHYKRGAVIQLSTGEYSSYQYVGLLVAIKNIDLVALAHQFQREVAEKEKDSRANPNDFPGWLVANEYALPVLVADVFLGTYEWEEDFELPESGEDDVGQRDHEEA